MNKFKIEVDGHNKSVMISDEKGPLLVADYLVWSGILPETVHPIRKNADELLLKDAEQELFAWVAEQREAREKYERDVYESDAAREVLEGME